MSLAHSLPSDPAKRIAFVSGFATDDGKVRFQQDWQTATVPQRIEMLAAAVDVIGTRRHQRHDDMIVWALKSLGELDVRLAVVVRARNIAWVMFDRYIKQPNDGGPVIGIEDVAYAMHELSDTFDCCA